MSFVHLHTHSEYSMIDGLPKIADLIANAVAKDFTAVALTDMHNLFAGIKFYTQAYEYGIKPIIGCEVRVDTDLPEAGLDCSVVLLCMNQIGYRNLISLLTQSYLAAEKSAARVNYRQLEAHHEGLLVLSGGCRGDLGQYWLLNRRQLADNALTFWKKTFPGRYYIEIFRTGRDDEGPYSDMAIACALEHKLPIVATNDVRFLEEKQFEIHEARVCIANGEILDDENRAHSYSHQQYLKTEEEMRALFSDIPEAIDNAAEIAKRCTVSIETDKVLLPNFPLPEGITADQDLRRQAEEAINKPEFMQVDIPSEDYYQRLEYELNIIAKMGYAGYFLIVADFVSWAKNNDIPVGPGRGSGAGSLVAYALGITQIDPLHYHLLFERFLNPERVSMPDIDIDFCMEKRDKVIEYVANRYGRDKVSQIITFGSMAAKAVVRDVGRIQGQAYLFVDELAKLIPNDLNITLKKALTDSPELNARYKSEPEVAAIINTGIELEGLSRNPGKHAGGIVIAPQPLTDYMASYCEPGETDSPLTQYDMKDIEKIGLVKFDFLGLKTLTVIDRTVRYVNQHNSNKLSISDIPLDDPATYELLQQARTKSIFQLESEGIRALLKRMKPDKFEDVVAILALYRPGPLKSGMVDDFIRGKHGGDVFYPHPKLGDILKPTYGVILYQEQVMQIAQILSDFSMGEADLLRRAMGKKLPLEMARQREGFISGALHNGVDRRVAVHIFDELINKFAGYGFNRSHSVGYALVTYQTAWLKTHYPATFMAAVLSTEMRFTDKTVESVYECRAMGITIEPLDVNTSQWEFEVIDDKTIRYGFGAVRHVGSGAINELIAERENGDFLSLQDFCTRMVPRHLKRNILQGLLTAGAMDKLGESRGRLLANMDTILMIANRHSEDAENGQTNLFGDSADHESVDLNIAALSDAEIRAKEKYSLGFYLTDHPMTEFKEEVSRMIGEDLQNRYNSKSDSAVWFAGVIMSVNKRRGGRSGVFFILDDGEHLFEFGLFGEAYKEYKELLVKDTIIFIKAEDRHEKNREIYSWRVNKVLTMEAARQQFAERILMQISLTSPVDEFIRTLQNSLKPFVDRNGCLIKMTVANEDACAELMLGEAWKVRLCDEVLLNLQNLEGIRELTVTYNSNT